MTSQRPATASTPALAPALAPALCDAALLLAFVLIGRASHNEGLLGTLNTWWPFVGGLAAGWLIMRAWRSAQRIVWTGIGIWLATVAGGLLLRIASGQGVQPSFAIVTTVVLGVFLLGWRGIALLVRRVRSRA
ncbi:MAG: DUF3054 domain-containing protein [Cryobacterium sp.]